MKYILRDSTYFILHADGGRNGQPVWCSFPFYAHRFDTLTDAETAAEEIRAKGWEIDEPRQLTGDDIALLNSTGELCYVCGPDPIADRPCVACGA